MYIYIFIYLYIVKYKIHSAFQGAAPSSETICFPCIQVITHAPKRTNISVFCEKY